MSGDKPGGLPEGFGRAAEKLANTVRHIVDLFTPTKRIRAIAHARSEADLIQAKGRAEVAKIKAQSRAEVAEIEAQSRAEIEARAIDRIRMREVRRQANVESITLRAVAVLPPPEDVSDDPVSEDWTTRFFEESQDISDEQMQQIWAKILAREVARPGSFSPRTLSVVRDLTREDANLFTALCRFVWAIPGIGPVPVIHKVDAPWVIASGVHLGAILHLETLGLINFNPSGYNLDRPVKDIVLSYFDKDVRLASPDAERPFAMGKVLFSSAGIELIEVAAAEKNEAIGWETRLEWGRMGWIEIQEVTTSHGTTMLNWRVRGCARDLDWP
jgi:hypothetical protein